MLFNFMKQKQTWKSNYSTIRLLFLVWSSLNFPSVFLCIIGCVIWPVGRFLVHSRSSFLPLYVNLFSYLVSTCWPNYCGIMLLVKGSCSTEVPHTVADPDLQIRGARSSRPWDKGCGLQKDFFRPFGPQFGLKIRGGPSPPGTSPRSATAIERWVFAIAMIYHVGNYSAKNFRSDLTNLYGCLLPRKDVFTYNSWD